MTNSVDEAAVRRSPGNKGGSYIAEAAIVLPLVILAIITVIFILMYFYEESTEQSTLHMELRQEAVEQSGRIPEETAVENSSSSTAGNTVTDTARRGLFKNISGHAHVGMLHRGLMSAIKGAEIKGSWCAADGVSFKRLQ